MAHTKMDGIPGANHALYISISRLVSAPLTKNVYLLASTNPRDDGYTQAVSFSKQISEYLDFYRRTPKETHDVGLLLRCDFDGSNRHTHYPEILANFELSIHPRPSSKHTSV